MRQWDAEMVQRPPGVMVGRGDYSARYNRWLYKSKERALRTILSDNGVSVEGADVLDIGSGLGYWLRWFRDRGAASVTGLDHSAEAVRRLSETFPDVRSLHADITGEIPLDQEFDIVSVVDVLFHLPGDDAFERALRNLASVVRPGGALVVTDRFTRTDAHLTGNGCWRSYDTYEKALRPLGLEIADTRSVAMLMNGGLHDMFARPRRLFSRPVYLAEEALAPVLYAVDGAFSPGRAANLQVMLARRLPG